MSLSCHSFTFSGNTSFEDSGLTIFNFQVSSFMSKDSACVGYGGIRGLANISVVEVSPQPKLC